MSSEPSEVEPFEPQSTNMKVFEDDDSQSEDEDEDEDENIQAYEPRRAKFKKLVKKEALIPDE